MPDDLKARAELLAAEAAIKATASAAAEGASRAGHGLLDALESAIFGRVGGAEAVVAAEQQADPLERLRARYGEAAPDATAAPPPAAARPDPLEKARAELERLKAERAARPADPKKSL